MEFENTVNLADVISASSSKPGSEPETVLIGSEASPDDTSSWSPQDTDESPFIELRFPSPIKITSLITRGGRNGEFVPKFTLKVSTNFDEEPENVAVSTRLPSGEVEETPKVFSGNDDDTTSVRHVLDQPLVVAVIRIYPIRSEPEEPISLKIEIRGCLKESTTTVPATLETTTVKEIVSTTPVVEEKSTTASSSTGTTTSSSSSTTSQFVASSTAKQPVEKTTSLPSSTTSQSMVVSSTTTEKPYGSTTTTEKVRATTGE